MSVCRFEIGIFENEKKLKEKLIHFEQSRFIVSSHLRVSVVKVSRQSCEGTSHKWLTKENLRVFEKIISGFMMLLEILSATTTVTTQRRWS